MEIATLVPNRIAMEGFFHVQPRAGPDLDRDW